MIASGSGPGCAGTERTERTEREPWRSLRHPLQTSWRPSSYATRADERCRPVQMGREAKTRQRPGDPLLRLHGETHRLRHELRYSAPGGAAACFLPCAYDKRVALDHQGRPAPREHDKASVTSATGVAGTHWGPAVRTGDAPRASRGSARRPPSSRSPGASGPARRRRRT